MNPEIGRCIGEDYRLVELIDETPLMRRWRAEQLSVGRAVGIEELRPDRLESRTSFLNDVKAKGSVDHPWIGSVYEAVDRDDLCFHAHELLPGPTLAHTATEGAALAPAQLASVVRRIAETQLHLESSGRATSPIGLEHIHVDGHAGVRIANLAVAGARPEDHSLRDVLRLGESLPPLLRNAQPGTTRMLSLFAWMRGEGIDAPLDWNRVREIAAEIETQLDERPQTDKPSAPRIPPWLASRKTLVLAACAALAILTSVTLVSRCGKTKASPTSAPRADSGIVAVSAGAYPTPDGLDRTLPAFTISKNEISIREYAGFLKMLDLLAQHDNAGAYDHPQQPRGKAGHLPDDWDAMKRAAETRTAWMGKTLSVDSPIVGIDWWDAVAYANWKNATLPTQEQWHAAIRQGLIHSTVEEWTASQASPPDNPHGIRRWVVIGPAPAGSAAPRQWTDDRGERRPARGFRIATTGD